MRKLEYLSPTSISVFLKSEDEFYLNYLCENRPPRDPQTLPMSIGSSFDAYVKSYLYENLFGKGHDPKFEFNTLFESQVEIQNRDWAKIHGQQAFKCYKASGALADLMLELQSAVGTPRFELEVRGSVNGYREGMKKDLAGITLLGKPDAMYINKNGYHVILDWKVNGWLSKRTVSPTPGYIKIRESNGIKKDHHKDCELVNFNGNIINKNYLEKYEDNWARQLAIYSWLVGVEVGSECIVAIDQLACSPSGFDFPYIKIAEHRSRISSNYQWQVFEVACDIWDRYHSEHYFKNLSKEESIKRCQWLDEQSKALRGEVDDNEKWFSQQMRNLNNRGY